MNREKINKAWEAYSAAWQVYSSSGYATEHRAAMREAREAHQQALNEARVDSPPKRYEGARYSYANMDHI